MPVELPKGVELKVSGRSAEVKGKLGSLALTLHPEIGLEQGAQEVTVVQKGSGRNKLEAMAGTTRALLANMVRGVSEGFERKLELVGVGYRAQSRGKVLNLTLGFSHPVEYPIPEGITIETPSQTEIVVKGADKQKVGQVAAEIRGYRPPEPYKGKGVRYSNERVVLKEAKKK